MLEPVSDCWPRRMATAAQAEQNPAYRSTPTIQTHRNFSVMMGFLLFTDENVSEATKLSAISRDGSDSSGDIVLNQYT
ncbi:hypothetical protein VPR01S_21_00770 [Vibrio proteolyticus NBRC 13287]|uniref:Uncharacterized protein n=1 Tax=Vibrio proteolyticus NBRC 13287 TaxID=1219065 RepID=U3A6N3_VIBPR|nr:hypothetical protein VPR01S_21_00770 [Vibrio proteolyticus NBRC 13287]